MIWVGVWSLLPPPIWNIENEHGWQVVHCASAAAIFIGWYFVSMTPSSLPTSSASTVAGSRTTIESPAERRNASTLELRRRCQADTASMRSPPVTADASSTWA